MNELRKRARVLRKNATKEENLLWYRFLRKYPLQFHRQVPLGNYIVDFHCLKARLVVELDGGQHYEQDQQSYDRARTAYLEETLHLKVLRFTNEEILRQFDEVCEEIHRWVELRYPSSVADATASPRRSHKETPMKKVTLYTDGSCSGNPGPGGWGAILMMDLPDGSLYKKEFSGGSPSTTNNIMEMTAVLEGLKKLKMPCDVTLISDSQYVINALEKGWAVGWRARGWKKADKTMAANHELWGELLRLIEEGGHTMHYTWVKGHATNAYNNRCDEMAVAETKKFLK